jgi:hypothetical protein
MAVEIIQTLRLKISGDRIQSWEVLREQRVAVDESDGTRVMLSDRRPTVDGRGEVDVLIGGLEAAKPAGNICAVCGAVIQRKLRGGHRRTCSDACRRKLSRKRRAK